MRCQYERDGQCRDYPGATCRDISWCERRTENARLEQIASMGTEESSRIDSIVQSARY